jgi:ribulose-phosphate 3-epimerase
MKLFPSIISANLLNLESVIRTIDSYVDGYHIDIMDDHFVPNLTWGPMFVAALRTITKRPFQIHLMVDNPATWVSRLACAAGDSFVFHVEAVTASQVSPLLIAAKKAGWRVGLAFNPATEIERAGHYLAGLDEVLIMSVNPGFSGQSFIDTSAKASELRALSSRLGFSVPLIAMDGGIGLQNIGMLDQAGIDLVGVASAIFSGPDPVKNIQNLRRAASCTQQMLEDVEP